MKRSNRVVLILFSFILAIVAYSQLNTEHICLNDIDNLENRKLFSSSSQKYVEHDPINITNDVELANAAVSGGGTENDPYLLQDFHIQSTEGHGIRINGTSKFFIVRNCKITTYWDFQEITFPSRIDVKYTGLAISNIANNTAKIENNTFIQNLLSIALLNAHKIRIINNSCYNSQFSVGVISCDNIVIENNRFRSSSTSHIVFSNVKYSQISSNIVEQSNGDGIVLLLSGNNSIVNNSLSHCKFFGVLLFEDCINNVIYYNVFINNSYGFPSGTPQAADNGLNNRWFDSNTNKGNFWSDYDGSGIYFIAGIANSEDPFPSRVELTTTTTIPDLFILLSNLGLGEIVGIFAILSIIGLGVVFTKLTLLRSKSKNKRSVVNHSLTSKEDVIKNKVNKVLNIILPKSFFSIYNLKIINISKNPITNLEIQIITPKTSKTIPLQGSFSEARSFTCLNLNPEEKITGSFSVISLSLPILKDINFILLKYQCDNQNNEFQLKEYRNFKNNELILKTRCFMPFKTTLLFLDLYSRIINDLSRLVKERIRLGIKNKILESADDFLRDEILNNWQYNILIVNKKEISNENDIITISMLKGGLIFAIKTKLKIKRKFTTMRETIDIKLPRESSEVIVTFATIQFSSPIPALGVFFKDLEIKYNERYAYDDLEILWIAKKGESLKERIFDLMSQSNPNEDV